MKKKLTISFILFSTFIFAQIPFPHISNNITGAERNASFGVKGLEYQRFEITNATNVDNKFITALWSHNGVDNRHAIQYHSTILASLDNGAEPIVKNIASITPGINLNAPSGTMFPWGNGGDQLKVNNRPTFVWINGDWTSDGYAMMLSASNQLGVGLTATTARIDVNGDARIRTIPEINRPKYVVVTDDQGFIFKTDLTNIGGGSTNCTSTNFLVRNTSAGTDCSQVYDSGSYVGINYPSPDSNFKFIVNGNTKIIGSIYATSDKKFKKNIHAIDNALARVLALNGKTYNWKSSEFPDYAFTHDLQYGLIAQEVQSVIPEIVNTSDDGTLSINYDGLIPVLIEALKEQQSQINILNDKISKLANETANFDNPGATYFSNNYPNPFGNESKIDVFVEDKYKSASILIYDSNGKSVIAYEIPNIGKETIITVSSSSLKPGIYFYSLVVDGNIYGTKKMIIK